MKLKFENEPQPGDFVQCEGWKYLLKKYGFVIAVCPKMEDIITSQLLSETGVTT